MKVIRWLDKHLEEAIQGVIYTVIFLILILQIFMRYVLRNPLSWSEEICRIIYVWASLLSLSYCVRHSLELRVDSAVNLLPKKVTSIVWYIISFINCGLYGFFGFYSVKVVETIYKGGQVGASTGIPMWVMYLSAIVGFFGAALREIQRIIRRIYAARKGLGPEIIESEGEEALRQVLSETRKEGDKA